MKLTQYLLFCAIVATGAEDSELGDLDHRIERLNANQRRDVDSKDGYLGARFAIEIPARRKECFYQKVGENAKLVVSFEVLKGSSTDRNILVKLSDPDGNEVDKFAGNEGDVEHNLEEEKQNVPGVYKACFYNIDNLFKRVVDINMEVTVENWDEHKDELPADLLEDMEAVHVVDSLTRLRSFFMVFNLQIRLIKRRMFADYLTVKSSMSYVTNLGTFSCLAIIGSGVLQVYFVRKLFETPSIRGTTTKA